MQSELLLKVENLCVEPIRPFDGSSVQRLLDGVNFTLSRREVLGVIGESGSGKTVLARAIAGGLPPGLRVSAGAVHYRGDDIAHMKPARLAQVRGNEVGYVGSDPTRALDPTLSIGSQLVEKLRAVRPAMGRREAHDKVIDMLGAVRIPVPAKRAQEYPFQFSGGMMQRVMIADALISEPAFLIADCVTQSLDVTVAAQILRLLRELVQRFDTAIVFVSASLPVVSQVADQVLVLQSGRVIERATPGGLTHAPQHAYTRALLEKLPAIWSNDSSDFVSQVTPVSAATSQIPLLEVVQVSKTYEVRDRSAFNHVHEVRAVRNVSFTVSKGESLGLVGESGCGKSSLTRLLTLLEKPDAGTIRFNGQNLADLSSAQLRALRPQFQLLLQDPYNSLPPGRTVGDIIAEPLAVHRIATRQAARQRVLAVMDEVGLGDQLFDELPVWLSAGQRQRVNVARALVLSPQLLILDETLSTLDQVEQSRMLQLFDRLQRQHGLTYVYISHDLAMVRRACSRVAVMYLGEVVELSQNETLYRSPGHPYSKALLSAIPTLESNPFDAKQCLLDGEPPSPIDLPLGCCFFNRCPQASEQCSRGSPPNVDRGRGSTARCFAATPAIF